MTTHFFSPLRFGVGIVLISLLIAAVSQWLISNIGQQGSAGAAGPRIESEACLVSKSVIKKIDQAEGHRVAETAVIDPPAPLLIVIRHDGTVIEYPSLGGRDDSIGFSIEYLSELGSKWQTGSKSLKFVQLTTFSLEDSHT